MNEHDNHPPEAPKAPTSPSSRTDDLECDRFVVGQEQLRRLPDLAPDEEAKPAATLRTIPLDDAPLYAETNVSVVREGIRRHGQPFLAYLILDGVEQRSRYLIEQHERRYLGSFPDRRSFAEWAIEEFGWNEDLVELRHLQGMWPDDVKWDLDQLWPTLLEHYAVTERLGGVHAFRK